jgi:large subunit ribosomal protein L4
MGTLPVYDRTGAEVGSYEIDPLELAPIINKQLMHDVVVMYQTNRRQGSAKTKSRAEVAGTTAKMYRQKGTGNARAGSKRSGVRRGGGHIFAKRPKDWSYSMPKKSLRAATRMAMASKIVDEQITLVDDLAFETPKTKDMAEIIKALNLSGQTLLVAVEQYDRNVLKSIRNIAGVSVLPVSDLNALEVLRPKRLLMTKAAMDAFREKAVSNPAASNLDVSQAG